jgi:hypothetical protein
MIRTHLGNLLEGRLPRADAALRSARARCRPPGLKSPRSPTATSRRGRRHSTNWLASGRLRSSASPVRLLLVGMLNGCSQWYQPGGRLSLDEIATAAAELLLQSWRDFRASTFSLASMV